MKKLFVAALAAMTLFASCAKDDAKNNGGDGVETTMGLTLAFPGSSVTRDLNPNSPTADEMKVHDIIIFLYGPDGKPAVGNMPTPLTLSDFTQGTGANSNVYTLKNDKRIITTTGVKSVYVGVNLTGSNFMTGITNLTEEKELKELYATSVAELIGAAAGEKLPGNSFRMFSQQAEHPVLVAESDPNWFDSNSVKVNVERQIAKMTADVEATLDQWEGGNYGVHSVEKYYLGQTAKGQMYRASQYNLAGKRITYTDPDDSYLTGLGYTHHYLPLNNKGVPLNATASLTAEAGKRTSFFGIENVPLNNLRRETSVAVFLAKFTPKSLTLYTGDGSESDPKAAWNDVAWVPITTSIDVDNLDTEADGDTREILPGSFWMVEKYNATLSKMEYKFFNTQDAAIQYVTDFNLAGATQPPITGAYLYQQGNTYFYVYLGDEVADTYEFVRNQYYHLTVKGFGGLGYPGTKDPQPLPTPDPEDPGTDPDPDDPTDPPIIPPGEPTPTVPDPDGPTPGNEDETTLRVEVTVLPWDVKAMPGLILSK